MRVLIADKLAALAADRLSAHAFDWHAEPSLKDDTLTEALAARNPEVLVVRSTKVRREHVEAAPALTLVVRAGAGVNTIDLDACAERGVFVANCPGRNSIAVAELTFGLLLAVDRHLASGVADLRAGRWNKGAYSKADGLAGKTLGILGMGGIGTEVARRARAFGMPVVAWSRSLTPEAAADLGVRHAASPLDVARAADVLTVHTALSDGTRGLVGAALLEALGDDGILLNTSRAEVVDSDALMAALDRGLRAGLDVFPDEPGGKEGPFDSPLAKHPNVVGSHHIGASTQQAQDSVATAVCEIVETFAATGNVPNVVNLARRTAADHVLNIRHMDRVGVLAAVLEALRTRGINVQEMDNRIFAGGKAASARIHVAGTIPDELIEAMLAHEHILNVSVVALDPDPEAP